jgi:cardiolipin synthase
MFFSTGSLLFGIAGAILATGVLLMPVALVVVAGIVRQKRSPASSVAWLVTILLLPLIGIPLFWLFGSRKIDRIAKSKPHVVLTPDPVARSAPQPEAALAAAHLGSEGITNGNFLKFHDNGEDAFADLMALIDTAKRSIHIETYVLKPDVTGTAIMDKLVAKAQQGLEVRLLIDGFGSFHMARSPLRKLRRAGGKYAFFLPIWRITLLNRGNLRDHRKIAVFDNERVFAGGRNLADEYLGPKPNPKRWADFSFVLDGPAAAHYDEIFRYDWEYASREKLPVPDGSAIAARQDGATVQVVPSGPDVTDDELFEGILSFIFSAKSRLWIVSPYFIPNEMLARALQIALSRGVDVRIVVPQKSDQLLVDLARGQFLRDLSALKAQVLLYTGEMVHAKAMLVDDVAATVGSANFDSRSMFLNFEVSSVIHSKAEVRAVEAWIEALMRDTRPFADIPGRRRDTIEGLARLVAPML